MRAGSEARRAIVGAMVGLLYGAVLALLSAFVFGGGHNISTPLLLSSAPVGLLILVGKLLGEPYVGYGYNAALFGAPLLWAVLGSLVALSYRGKALRLTQVLALLQRVRTRAHRDSRRATSGAAAAGGHSHLGAGLPGWARGVVVKPERCLRNKASDRRGNGRAFVRIHSLVPVNIRGWRWSRHRHSLGTVVSAA